MSGLANLFNVPSTPTELAEWSSAHMAAHRDISRRIYELSSGLIVLPEYILDPFDPRDTGVWRYQHQLLHTAMDEVLGIDGFDLSDVDFTNPDILSGWIDLHSNEHYQASDILEIG